MHEGKKQDQAPEYFRTFGLDTKSKSERINTVGGSDINTLASGDADAIHKLWLQKTGQLEPDDLTMVWPVIMGHVTETANTEWCAYKLGLEITDRQRVIKGVKHSFMRCTLDGRINGYKNRQAVYDAKYTAGRPMAGEEWRDVIPRLVKRYTPQLHWNAFLIEEATGKTCPYGVLGIVRAGNEPVIHEVPINKKYTLELISMANYFIGCCDLGIEPTDIVASEPPVPSDEKTPVDMATTNHALKWKHHAEIWAQTFGAADSFKKAETELKKLVPRQASEAFGNGIRIRVAKNNSKRIEVQND